MKANTIRDIGDLYFVPASALIEISTKLLSAGSRSKKSEW